jgi:hypothetical protein
MPWSLAENGITRFFQKEKARKSEKVDHSKLCLECGMPPDSDGLSSSLSRTHRTWEEILDWFAVCDVPPPESHPH